ncbi:hypothetical protein CSA56_04860 [candidate division KSB3 bacterium]|uniref:SH3b domain-containing protein n=1 Tax=candidate division KSB3 bacterium TaxID=2044937 RepID=A0A2G6KHY1_9BACT|nr:MAG: hypothetical protein CSA56_04860 [candidate division KSB3 bacterium]
MKIRKMIVCLGCLLILMLVNASTEAEKLMSVEVKEAKLRSGPSYLRKVVTTVAYAQQVNVLGEKGDWKNVSVPGSGTKGWMHESALTKKTIILKAGEKDIEKAATSDEVALAGKGFNEEVEKQFKEGNASVNYAVVNEMEKIVISQPEMEQFLTAGEIFPEGGAQ